MIYEAAQLIEQVAEASAVLFSMVLLFGALGILFYVRRFDYPASTVDIRDGQRGICNGCDKERHDLKEGHCRPCRDDIEARAW